MNMTEDRMNLVKLFVSLMVFIFSDRRSYEYECFLVHYLLSWRSIPEQIREQKNVNSQNKKKTHKNHNQNHNCMVVPLVSACKYENKNLPKQIE